MKVKFFILSFVVAIFLSSAIQRDRNLSVGSHAPAINTVSGESIFNRENNKDQNIVVSVWNPKIPSSRILNKKLSESFKNSGDTKFISICNDSDSVLMNEILFVDKVHTGQHLNIAQISERTLKDYDIRSTTGAFLISKEGKIAMKL